MKSSWEKEGKLLQSWWKMKQDGVESRKFSQERNECVKEKKKTWTNTACLTRWHLNHRRSLNSNWHLNFALFTPCLALGVCPACWKAWLLCEEWHTRLSALVEKLITRDRIQLSVLDRRGTFLSMQSAAGTTGGATKRPHDFTCSLHPICFHCWDQVWKSGSQTKNASERPQWWCPLCWCPLRQLESRWAETPATHTELFKCRRLHHSWWPQWQDKDLLMQDSIKAKQQPQLTFLHTKLQGNTRHWKELLKS